MKAKLLIFNILLIILNNSIRSASLPDNYYGNEQISEYYGYYESQNGYSNQPILGASYNLWEMGYSTQNVNGDNIFGFPINDRVYSDYDFYAGDEIHYNSGNPSLFYTLTETQYDGYLTYDSRDANEDGVVTSNEVLWWSGRYFVEGDPVPIGDFIPLYIMAILLLIFKIFKINKIK
jgi:hypothetical protein